MRSQAVRLSILALTAAPLVSGCGAPADDVAICVDPETEERVEDDECDDAPEDVDEDDGYAGGGFYWFYIPTGGGYRAPAVGSSIDTSRGTFVTPSSSRAVVRGGVSSQGGSVAGVRTGGFGGGGSSSS